MRILGVILLVLGLIALAVPSFTFFTTERAVETRFINIDVQKPHTIFLNPVAGGVAVAAGVVLLLASRKSGPVV